MKPIDLTTQRGDDRIDLAEEVKSRITMVDIVAHFSGLKPIMNRVPCPFHNGHDRNLALYRNGYKCYVCGASGDIIGYVQAVTGMDFIGAVREIDRAFGLGLPLEGDGKVDPALVREAALRAAKRQRERMEEEEREEDRELVWDVWSLCDRVLREASPSDPRYAIAAKHIDYLTYLTNIYG